MDQCPYLPVAIPVLTRTLDIITALNYGITPEINEATCTHVFMIYCFGSDHEDREVISLETYDRTYSAMPDMALVAYVNTID